MGWFLAAVLVTAKVAVVAVGTVAAVGIVAYGIYKADQYMSHGGRKKRGKNKSGSLATFEDIKPKMQDSELRGRKVDSDASPETNPEEPVTVATPNNPSVKKCDQETQVAPPSNISVTKCHQETQATPPNNLSFAKSHQETQTVEELPSPCDISGLNIAFGNSNTDGEVNSATNNGTESVYSFNSMSSGSSTTCNIPKWSEMTNEEKCLSKCTPCGKIVTTITYPCKHPYFCSECAPFLFKFYHRCPKCKHRIKSFDYV